MAFPWGALRRPSWLKSGDGSPPQTGRYQQVPSSPAPPYQDDTEMMPLDSPPSPYSPAPPMRKRLTRDPHLLSTVAISVLTLVSLALAFPFPTTIHVFLSLLAALVWWTVVSWVRIFHSGYAMAFRQNPRNMLAQASNVQVAAVLLTTGLTLFTLAVGFVPPTEVVPTLQQDKYYIAANLYNYEAGFPRWSRELLTLVGHLGPENTFVSIYESNSNDATPQLLAEFAERLTALGSAHKIVSDTTDRWWPYGTSPLRIDFLARARNKAMEPLQSESTEVRLEDYESYTKILFLNDVIFTWKAAVQLLGTSLEGETADYDMACGMDFYYGGLYDTWVARDICGTPMRIAWPFVKDPVSADLLREEKPFPVSACWNGMVAFKSQPFLYKPSSNPPPARSNMTLFSRGWKSVDNPTFPNSRMSPPLTDPILFRSSGIDACEHSECFLVAYDLHRLYRSAERPSKIIMNPNVRTAYDTKWWTWNNVILRAPIVQLWTYYWSHGWPRYSVEWIWEWACRRRDYCTWTELANTAPARCPPLPGPTERHWDQ